ncbi:putative Phosphatidylcholine:ceramide cholinephosphotransferase 1 [Hypsibius exemplaris]|uniref:Phosphatidylcholine:ceramide cholinephosphotransferase 1 n=1 Tax=Hypsibius exemplaris TaxID=2072580 RepID=A0A1W0WEP7_HYPEX|nr:putative Phosphatidylcholine:ceramide cholinephosphotransferase 1 [Hypsibius exemplaris]
MTETFPSHGAAQQQTFTHHLHHSGNREDAIMAESSTEHRPLLQRAPDGAHGQQTSSPPKPTRLDYESTVARAEVYISVEPEMEPDDASLTGNLTNCDGAPSGDIRSSQYQPERLKTVLAFGFMSFCMFCTTLALAIVHDRLPDTGPLPDVVFDWVPQYDVGLTISEYLLVCSVWMSIFLVIFHRYRWIIFRRLFIIIGLLYFGRSITMLVTAVPVANTDYYCSPKLNHTSALAILERIGKLIGGLGLSFNGLHTYCGDYIYSGHTCMLVLSALVMTEYAPRKLIPIVVLSYLFAVTGIVMVSVSRGHYTVDIIVAYYITTRIFWMYHSMVANASLKEFGPTNYFTNVCWFRLMRFCEANVAVGKLPKHYTWPLPFPRRWQQSRWEYQN